MLRRLAPRNDEEKVSVAWMSEAKSGSGRRDYARDLGKQRDHNNFLPDGQITSCFPKWPVQPLLQKYFCFGPRQISSLIRAVPPQQRGVAHVTNAGRDAVDAGSALDEMCCSGRRSRVVLTPRCWRQVCEKKRRRRCQTSLVTGESTKETVKPLRGECRVKPV